ncbi:unnamed protein product [marine sediment metagenome]|uniref:Uncharacterized protein n=1 Tax=marine sediment metagenome TaxID=412755 RepID=X0XW59_9ZZZZ
MHLTKIIDNCSWTYFIPDLYYNHKQEIINLTNEELKNLHPKLTSYRNNLKSYS